jgi:hypothetical protein
MRFDVPLPLMVAQLPSRDVCVLVPLFCSSQDHRSIGLDQLGPIMGWSEPDVVRRRLAQSRDRKLCIPPASVARSTTNDDVGTGI